MVPGPVATLEAPLGHITEHLLQLLGGGGSAGVPTKEIVFAWSVAKSKQWKGGGPTCACACVGGTRAGGAWSDVAPLTDSNRLKMAHPHLLWPHTLFR